MGKLDHVEDTVVKCLAVGEPQTSIAEQVGVDQSTISRFASKDKIRNLIREEQEKLVKVLPDTVQNVKDLVNEMKDIPKDDTKRRELSYKASKDVLKATNVFPSPQYAHSIYNDNRQQENVLINQRKQIISQTMIKLVGEHIHKQLEKFKDEGVT